MCRVWLSVVGLAFVAGVWSVADGAVIVTTTGEEIVCEIVKETDTYFIIDHRGYRRYVLKSSIRTLNREAGEGYGLGEAPQRFVSLAGGYEFYGSNHTPGFSGGRLTLGFPANRYVSIEGNLHVGLSRVDSPHGPADQYSGPVRWTGATIGALWSVGTARVIPIFEAGVGYFFLDHTIDQSEVQALREALLDFFEMQDYTEAVESGVGFTMGFGGVVRLTPRFSLDMRTGVLVISTNFRRQWHIVGEDGVPYVQEESHGLLLRMIQTHVGVRVYF
jgi:hypothetical protein